jgi:hypothetical protein
LIDENDAYHNNQARAPVKATIMECFTRRSGSIELIKKRHIFAFDTLAQMFHLCLIAIEDGSISVKYLIQQLIIHRKVKSEEKGEEENNES